MAYLHTRNKDQQKSSGSTLLEKERERGKRGGAASMSVATHRNGGIWFHLNCITIETADNIKHFSYYYPTEFVNREKRT